MKIIRPTRGKRSKEENLSTRDELRGDEDFSRMKEVEVGEILKEELVRVVIKKAVRFEYGGRVISTSVGQTMELDREMHKLFKEADLIVK